MPFPNAITSQRTLLFTLALLLAGGFLVTSLLSYYASRSSIRDNIIHTELPLTSDTVYSEIQKDLVRPTLIASMMSRDTFMRDWVVSGENNPEQIIRYLREVHDHYGAYTSFFISEKTGIYYQAKGILKTIKPGEPRDAWYYRVRDMSEPYEISFDPDMANQDRPSFFINYKVFDYNNRFIGAAGVGLTVDAVVKLIDRYQQRYDRGVFFVDTRGVVVLTGTSSSPHDPQAGQTLLDLPGLGTLMEKLPQANSDSYEYTAEGADSFVNVRFIPELNWFLFVTKKENGALDGIRHSLYLNLAICLAVTLIVMLLLNKTLHRYQSRLEAQATLDPLTGLPNRRGFNLLASNTLDSPGPVTALLLDLDHFKHLNDTHGHLAGDAVLAGFAEDLKSCLRQSDVICRWGGEEFIVLLKDSDLAGGQRVAEQIRRLAEQHDYFFSGSMLQVTVSVGLTERLPNDNLHDLIARADRALYQAKLSGRNQVCVERAVPV
ncbi:sensor domain-containing diguanylate cyclase [Pseudomonas sp. LJDD11]|uniref:sensor domain-containing diguanylate cyclase n=1 Tax=unclassified Pseudomonas TaxID=196821 RepID=UPI0004F6DA34|nr:MULTISPECIES: sensor domain-containing diguanylate cyclase [unclassified Pseudomonas]MCO8162232.1 sensor domain-containing diguanylate cyclase [Pseudomonas sp. 21LCFQ010]MCQ9422520.1 sensor domain-containing diguanylate cyclase [Pseudomonas sp. LJDD11]BAP43717.1 diguanylate cyclase (GGDEF) domain protein [Pseudomonas sp. StFLB209]